MVFPLWSVTRSTGSVTMASPAAHGALNGVEQLQSKMGVRMCACACVLAWLSTEFTERLFGAALLPSKKFRSAASQASATDAISRNIGASREELVATTLRFSEQRKA